ncbi:hypothetical protein GCM10027435_28620 [Haloparvum alkalitolerans]
MVVAWVAARNYASLRANPAARRKSDDCGGIYRTVRPCERNERMCLFMSRGPLRSGMNATPLIAVLLAGCCLVGGVGGVGAAPTAPIDGAQVETPADTPDGTSEADGTADSEENDTANASDDGPGFGSAVSSFVQSTTAETSGEVDQGMWEARVEGNVSAEAVENRSAELADRVADLRERRAALAARYENGSLTPGEYRAKDARLRAELRSIGTAADETSAVAERSGVPEAAAARAKEVAAAASEASGRPATPGGGPPDGVPGEGANRSGNGSGPPGAGDGPGTGAGDGAGNGAGNGTGNGAGAGAGAGGPPDDAGSEGNGTGAEGDGGDGTGAASDPGNGDRGAGEGNGPASDRSPPNGTEAERTSEPTGTPE